MSFTKYLKEAGSSHDESITEQTKQVWQITRDEHIKNSLKNALGRQRVLNRSIAKSQHFLSVLHAIRDGKTVPKNVLADYKDFKDIEIALKDKK